MTRSLVTVGRGLGASLVGALLILLLAASPLAAATGWTGPLRVGAAGHCTQVAAAIDSAGRYHLAAECGGSIRYSFSFANRSWSTTSFSHPAGRADFSPQVAIDGNVVYVAYSRDSDEGCGEAVDAGVYYRKRSLPSGAWSAARRIGPADDHLQSFRVVAGTLHATVANNHDGRLYYETSTGAAYHRYLISGGFGTSSLRIGSDGAARIVYQGEGSLRYATFTGSGFTTTSIPGTTGEDRNPLLVLDAANHAHVVWSREPGPGCAIRDPNPDDGTYYATNKTGAWSAVGTRRITTNLGATSLTADVGSGRVHVLVAGSGVRYYSKPAAGAWTGQLLSSSAALGAAIRLDQSSGTLLAVYSRQLSNGDSGSIYYLTKP